MNMVQQFDPAQLDLSQDYGTPAINAEVEVTVHINGMPVTVPEGTSVMRAAAIAGARVCTLSISRRHHSSSRSCFRCPSRPRRP